MNYFTVSAKGRKGHNFDHMGYMYQLDIDMNGKLQDFYIHADNRKSAVTIAQTIVSTITFESTTKEVQAEVEKQNGVQQLKVAYRMLETHEDADKVMNYIQRLKAHFNIVDETIEQINEEEIQVTHITEGVVDEMKDEMINVSRDNGKTWNIEEIDIKQLNPEKSKLKVGDLIERNGLKYEIKLTTGTPEEHKNNKCFKVFEQFENMLYASAIIEEEKPAQPTQNEQSYIAYNRSFSSYELAYDYCIQSDLDTAHIVTEEPEMASLIDTTNTEPAIQSELFYLYSNTFTTYLEAFNYAIKNRIDAIDMIISSHASISNEQLLKLKMEYVSSKSSMTYADVTTYYSHLLTVPTCLSVDDMLYGLKRLIERHESRMKSEQQREAKQVKTAQQLDILIHDMYSKGMSKKESESMVKYYYKNECIYTWFGGIKTEKLYSDMLEVNNEYFEAVTV